MRQRLVESVITFDKVTSLIEGILYCIYFFVVKTWREILTILNFKNQEDMDEVKISDNQIVGKVEVC